jgi:hypothetical protein
MPDPMDILMNADVEDEGRDRRTKNRRRGVRSQSGGRLKCESRSVVMQARYIKDLALALLAEAEAMGANQHPDIGQGFCLREAVRRFEIDLITDALRRSGGNQARAAALLGTKITTLHHKIKHYRIKTNLLPCAAENEPALNVSTPQGALVMRGTAAEAQRESAAG